MTVIVTLVVVGLLGFWVLATYSRLIGLRSHVRNAWRHLSTQLIRRHDLIPNLVDTLRGAVGFEPETLESVVAARNRAATASGPVDAAAKEGELTQALERLFALVESNPQLTAHEHVRALREELTSTANKVELARRSYNDIATTYNTSTQMTPARFIAALGNFPRAALFSDR